MGSRTEAATHTHFGPHANAFEEEKQESLAAGCNEHLVKPIRKRELLEALSRYAGPAPPSPQPGSSASRIPVTCPPEIEEAVPLFLESVGQDLETLVRALHAGDYSKVRFIGHDLKGTGGGYGFEAISAIGKSIEQAAKASDAAEIARQIAALTDYLDRVEVSYR